MGLPENIDALLVKFDITQEQLAYVAGVHPSSVVRWRHGSQMRKAALERICSYFDLEEDDLISTENGLAAKEHGYVPDASLSDDERELIGIMRSIDEPEYSVLMKVARSLRKPVESK